MKHMLPIGKTKVWLMALSALIVGSGAGVGLAQGLWQASGAAGPQKDAVTNKAYFPVKHCVNIGGALEAPNEGDWYNYKIRERDMAAIAKVGFDTVRIPIKWSAHALESAPYTIDEAFFARIDQVIGWAVNSKLAVIIDVHHYDELYTDPDRHETRLEALWAQIATRYEAAPREIIFEIINEPRDAFSGPRVNKVQARILSTIRKTNPTRTVILTGDQWGTIDGSDNLVLPNDPFVVGSVHYYSPYEFTHQGAEFADNPPPTGRTWPQKGEPEQLVRDVARITAFRARIQAPVLVGEYGALDTIPLDQRVAWTRDVHRAFEAINVPSCYFNYAAGFGLYDLKNEQWKRPLLSALGLEPN
jgi:endoglucanase